MQLPVLSTCLVKRILREEEGERRREKKGEKGKVLGGKTW